MRITIILVLLMGTPLAYALDQKVCCCYKDLYSNGSQACGCDEMNYKKCQSKESGGWRYGKIEKANTFCVSQGGQTAPNGICDYKTYACGDDYKYVRQAPDGTSYCCKNNKYNINTCTVDPTGAGRSFRQCIISSVNQIGLAVRLTARPVPVAFEYDNVDLRYITLNGQKS